MAVLSDIHGNRWALEAVLDDISGRGIDEILNLGDSLYGPLDPRRTADVLLGLEPLSVAGNEDTVLLAAPHPDDPPTLAFTREALSQEHLGWLASLAPTSIHPARLFLCHGSPGRDDEYLLREVAESGTRAREAEEVARLLANVKQPVVLCGHDHLPAVLSLGDGRLVVNPGSVGLPAYSDDTPHPHVMENGAPDARYALLTLSATSVLVEQITVPYDFEAAARVAETNDRPDWALWLRTGRCASLRP